MALCLVVMMMSVTVLVAASDGHVVTAQTIKFAAARNVGAELREERSVVRSMTHAARIGREMLARRDAASGNGGEWVLGARGQTCGDACDALGKDCDPTMPSTLTTNAALREAMAMVGRNCRGFLPPKPWGGAPFTTGFKRNRRASRNNRCRPIEEGATASCDAIRNANIHALCFCTNRGGGEIGEYMITNPSFENGAAGWTGNACAASRNVYEPSISLRWRREFPENSARCALSTRNAPPHGDHYMSVTKGGTCEQIVGGDGARLAAGRTYTLSAFARGVNDVWGGLHSGKAGVATRSIAKLELVAVDEDGNGGDNADTVLASTTLNVGAPKMRGFARADRNCARCGQDDGANIWNDGEYRLHAGNTVLYTRIDEDPMTARWKYANNGIVDGMALAPVITPNLKGLIATWYRDEDPVWSKMTFHRLLGQPPRYRFDGLDGPGVEPLDSSIIVQNSEPDEDPWAIDAHTFYDEDEQRLWLTYGGHETWIAELDPETAELCCSDRCATKCSSTEFDETRWAHTLVMSWDEIGSEKQIGRPFSGDGCGQAYQEGPALHKFEGNWFLFSSYGSMGEDYTIRVCRSETSPRGPYYDKSGRDCARYTQGAAGQYDEARAPGSSMLLGPEGQQSVPGHPHFIEEDGQLYLGYDFRRGAASTSEGGEGYDFMAIRKIAFVKDLPGASGWWPTVWQEISVTVDADTLPSTLLGRQLKIRLSGVGGAGSKVAFDGLNLDVLE